MDGGFLGWVLLTALAVAFVEGKSRFDKRA
jgi:hypothetical protein